MELMLHTFPLFITLVIFLFMVRNLGKRNKTQYPIPKTPPGPWKLPIIGHMHHLLWPLPHHTLRDLANKHGPLMHLWRGQVPTLVFSSPKLAEEMMKTNDTAFAARPAILAAQTIAYDGKDLFFAPYGDYWRQLRKICILELLSAKRIQSFHLVREEEVSDLVRYISLTPNSPVNLTENFFSLATNITSRAASVGNVKTTQGFMPAMMEAVELAAGLALADLFPSVKLIQLVSWTKFRLQRIHRRLDRILSEVIREHIDKKAAMKTKKGESEEDLVDVLLRVQQDGETSNFPSPPT